MTLRGVTDSLSNTFVLSRMMTSKFPLVVILGELAAQMRAKDMELGLEWVARSQNKEADSLTKGSTPRLINGGGSRWTWPTSTGSSCQGS